jgi:uncharacterized protein (TIGR02265 family)
VSHPPSQRIIFAVQAEGLLRGLAPDVTEALKMQLKRAGLDPDGTLPPGWPAEQLKVWLDLASAAIYPDFTLEEAHRRIGRRFVDGWQRTVLGAASAQFLKLLGVKRALERLTRAFRTSDNFSEASVEFPANCLAIVSIHSQPLPHYIAGILDGGLSMLKVNGKVSIEAPSSSDAMSFRIEWES